LISLRLSAFSLRISAVKKKYMKDNIESLRQDLIQNADEKTRLSGERFFKEEVKMYGVKSAVGTRISREHFKAIQDKSKSHIFTLCEELWQSGIMEESFVACNWSFYVRKDFAPEDFVIFERWVNNYVKNWASCDTLCNHTIGSFIEMYPEFLTGLKRWALSDIRWVKRASSVSLIIPAKNGKFLKDIFEMADILLTDRDDMVQKGYGWMLKAASKAHEKEVFDYVIKHKSVMPRTSLRYAIEKMPNELKVLAMAK
jgi:3-methyladenine DNA glycosylase AlkD